jgi:F-type H+-transporting ATPase subunit a
LVKIGIENNAAENVVEVVEAGSEMAIENANLWPFFKFGEEQIYITQSMLSTWLVMAFMICIAIIVRIKLKSFKNKPTGFQNGVETAVEMLSNLAKSTINEKKLEFLGGWFFTVFFFILFSNLSGLVQLRPPTSDIATTVPLALTTFFIIHIVGMKFQKGVYFKEYLKPIFIFLPTNIIGELARPLSLSFRLFGNIVGGVIIMEIMYSMLPFALRFLMPIIGHVYFDLFAGGLQAFVFTMLSLTFISLRAATD